MMGFSFKQEIAQYILEISVAKRDLFPAAAQTLPKNRIRISYLFSNKSLAANVISVAPAKIEWRRSIYLCLNVGYLPLILRQLFLSMLCLFLAAYIVKALSKVHFHYRGSKI